MFTENDKETSPEFKNWLSSYIKFTNSHSRVVTVLHRTCCSPFFTIKVVKLFLNGKADPNAQAKDGYTPLHYLAANKYFPNVAEATKLLLGVGARLDQPNNVGATSLDYFKARKTYLEQIGIVPDPYLQMLSLSCIVLSFPP